MSDAGDMQTPPAGMPASAADLAERLGRTGYLTDDGLATIGYLALAMQRPLLLEGEPGTGKTALAEALAEALDLDADPAAVPRGHRRQPGPLRLGLRPPDPAPAHDRGHQGRATASTRPRSRSRCSTSASCSPVRSCRRSGRARSCCSIDEIDRADDEFEAFLLEVLSTNQVTIPEYGTVTAATPPIVVLTSNRTREVHDALKRRCLYHWVDHPGLQREIEIVRRRLPDVPPALAEQVARATGRLRDRDDLVKPPGVAETLDWARALHTLGCSRARPRDRGDHAGRRAEVPRGRRAGPRRRSTRSWRHDRRRSTGSVGRTRRRGAGGVRGAPCARPASR